MIIYSTYSRICRNGGSALRLIRSYFSDRTQRVQIDGILSDFASLLRGVPQGSVLGPMKFVYICFHLVRYSDTIILAITFTRMTSNSTFQSKDPLESLTKLNMCISDIRTWMIKNKLKLNDSKTDFLFSDLHF